MKKFMQFKSIKARMTMGFAVIIVFVLVMGIINFFGMKKMDNDIETILNREQSLLVLDNQLAQNMTERTNLIQSYMITNDPTYIEQFEEGTEESINLENMALQKSQSEELENLIAQKVEWGTRTDVLLDFMNQGDADSAARVMQEEVQPMSDELVRSFNALADERQTAMESALQGLQSENASLTQINLAISVAVIILAIFVATMTSAQISKPLRQVTERMKQLAQGNLTSDSFETNLKDETGQLMVATNEMSENLSETLQDIARVSEDTSSHSKQLADSAESVQSETEQIAATMQELASGTETQAATASDLATAMDSFTQEVVDVHQNGEQMVEASELVLSLAGEGKTSMSSSAQQMDHIYDLVKLAVERMEHLDKQANQITNLVTIVQEIADQTDLLALNAAIEAARAGEQGKGFAVVADEVRKLAEQVSESVKDITRFVEGIQKESKTASQSLSESFSEVEEGTSKIRGTEETFGKIDQSIQQMNGKLNTMIQKLGHIAETSQEMSSSIDDIAAVSEESAAGVEQTSASAQQITGASQEVSASSAHLASLSDKLNQSVSSFTFTEEKE